MCLMSILERTGNNLQHCHHLISNTEEQKSLTPSVKAGITITPEPLRWVCTLAPYESNHRQPRQGEVLVFQLLDTGTSHCFQPSKFILQGLKVPASLVKTGEILRSKEMKAKAGSTRKLSTKASFTPAALVDFFLALQGSGHTEMWPRRAGSPLRARHVHQACRAFESWLSLPAQPASLLKILALCLLSSDGSLN